MIDRGGGSHSARAPAPIVFTACDLVQAHREGLHAAGVVQAAGAADEPSSRRREVSVNGKRVRTIDVHAHCVIPRSLELMGLKLENQRGPGLGEVGARRIAEMDAQGIDVERSASIRTGIGPSAISLPRWS